MENSSFLPGQMNAIDAFIISDTLLDILKTEREIGMEAHKDLFFLIDSPSPSDWIKKAITTATFHEIPMNNDIMSYFVKAKTQMKEDRKSGLHLW